MSVPESELRERYRNASDEELSSLAEQGSSAYTDTAWALLRDEMRRRGLRVPPAVQAGETPEERPVERAPVTLPLSRGGEVADTPDEDPALAEQEEAKTSRPPGDVASVVSGRGDDYFRVWVVRIWVVSLLTLLTLGLYLAWAMEVLEMGNLTVGIGLAIFFFVVFLWAAIRIVAEYQRLVVFRLGRCIGEKGPGIVILIPLLDRAVRVDLREQFLEIPHQTCITKDNAPISIDFLIYSRVSDPVSSALKVQDFLGASRGVATTTLRAIVGDIPLDDVLAKREQINQVLRTKLDEVTERWGVKVTTVEIREITPPHDVQEAMNKQMAAERTRRAVVTQADGQREAAVKVADGEKQAAILRAEGERQGAILRAEGFSLALEKIYAVARGVDTKTMGLQYLDALKALGASPATKIIVPLELTQLLRRFADGAEDGK